MNKLHLNELIVVEGKTDIDFLSSFIEADFYSVNGSAIYSKDISFLKEIEKNRPIIILTDPDFPGKKIREILNSNLTNVYNAYVRKEFAIKNHKVGVAESTINEVLLALNNLKKFETNVNSDLTMNDLYELNLNGSKNSKQLRRTICDYLHIEYLNATQLLKKLKMLGLNKNDLMEIIKNAKWKWNKRIFFIS